MQVATIIGHEFLDARIRHLGEQIADFLIVPARLQRLHDFPVLALFCQLDFTGRTFQNRARHLCSGEIGQLSIAKIIRLF